MLLPALLLALTASVAQPVQAVAVQKKVLVEFRRQGGFAGFDDRVIVYTDGCARVSRRTAPAAVKCLTKAEMRTLRGHLKRLRIGPSQAQPQGADHLKYTLAYRGQRASRYTLTRRWTPVVRDLEKLLAK